MTIGRVYSHKLLRDLFAGEADFDSFCARHKNCFPMKVLVLVDGTGSLLQRAVDLVICGRLRAKGYRLRIVPSDRDENARREGVKQLRRFFWSLGETNIEIATTLPLISEKEQYQLVISNGEVEKFESVKRVAFPRVDEEGWDLRTNQGRYVDSQVLIPWCEITKFDRPFQLRVSENEPTASGSREEDHRWNLKGLLDEIADRQSFRPAIPRRQINLLAKETVAVFQNNDAVTLWKSITSGAPVGITLDDLAVQTERDYPRLLRAMKLLLASGLVVQVADRSFPVIADYLTADIQPTSAREAECSDANEMIADGEIPIICIFPSALFGYDLDDGDKCTAVRMIKAGEARFAEVPPPGAVILDPTSEVVLATEDMPRLSRFGACIIDTAWYKLPEISHSLERQHAGCVFRSLSLPTQTNAYYQNSTKVSSAAAAAFVAAFAGKVGQARRILDLFEWGSDWAAAIDMR